MGGFISLWRSRGAPIVLRRPLVSVLYRCERSKPTNDDPTPTPEYPEVENQNP